MENKALSRQSNVPRAADDTLEDSLYPRACAEFCLGSRYPRRGPKHVLQNLGSRARENICKYLISPKTSIYLSENFLKLIDKYCGKNMQGILTYTLSQKISALYIGTQKVSQCHCH